MEYNNRAYPKNMEVLDRMIARRAELARLIGFDSWADYITADKMVGNATQRVRRSSIAIVAASGPKAEREYDALLKRKQQDVPGATVVNAWERAYYAELVRKSELRVRFAGGPAVFRLRPRQAGAARRHEQAVRRDVPAA